MDSRVLLFSNGLKFGQSSLQRLTQAAPSPPPLRRIATALRVKEFLMFLFSKIS